MCIAGIKTKYDYTENILLMLLVVDGIGMGCLLST